MPGTDPSPPKAAFPNQGDTDADIKKGGAEGVPTDQAAAAPNRFEPPADPSTSNPNTSTPSKVSPSSSSYAPGSSTTARQGHGQGAQLTDNPMLVGEKVKGLHRAIDEFVEAVRTDGVPAVGGETSGPQRVVQRLQAWKEESAGWQSGKSKL